MSGRAGLQCPGAFESGPGVLSEIDRALALIGAAHWTEQARCFRPAIGLTGMPEESVSAWSSKWRAGWAWAFGWPN